MTKSKLFLTTTLLLGSLALGSVALAGPSGGESGNFMRGMRSLDLTEDQKTELRELREGAREDRTDSKAELQSIRDAFMAELAEDSPNVATLHELTDRRAELRTAGAHDKVDRLVQVHAVLTAEQRAELLENMEERRTELGERGEERGGRRGR
ncbi:MAG: Spy/CpxP family protein refolding chaperone [Myxococcota bacterium]|jgi:Spy/CpxP family protein refolding chaperone